MSLFQFSTKPLDSAALRGLLASPAAGGYASFEGWVRNHNEGREVHRLEYEAFEGLAVKEGERIVTEALQRFGVERAACVHRVGALEIGELAVWVGVSARHRHEAFLACRYIIDAVKHRVPIWKKEHYRDGDSGWVNCERCAAPPDAPVKAHRHEACAPHTHHSEHAHPPRGNAPLAPRPDYSRQMVLPEVGGAGQARLAHSAALIVGCGGLGVPAMSYLAAAGIGRLGLVDADLLEASNLHRQPLYSLADVGRPKVELAAERLRALNPTLDLRIHRTRLGTENVAALIDGYDVILDCTDTIASKLALNDACVQSGQAAVFASVYQYEGQLQVLRPGGGPCLRCVWPETVRDGLVGVCAEAGVLGPVPGILGTLQALEALKLLLGLPAYGYIWNDSTLGATAYWISGMQNEAAQHGAVVLADPTSGEDTFSYPGGTGQHTGWYVGGRGLTARIALAHQAGWGGVVAWRLDYGLGNWWPAWAAAYASYR